MAEDTLTMFGKTYNTVGSASSNLLLQTRGDIKIRWGNKFIDLIKNGKVNAEVDILKKVNDTNAIHTDGVYLVNNGETDEIWVRIDGNLINLKGEIGDTYVSYKGLLEVTVDEKFMALNNIGLYYKTQGDLVNSGILNGVAFVLESGKFFTITNGEIKEYTIDTIIPDPLVVKNITINGTSESIYATNMLTLGLNNNKYITAENNTVTFYTKVIARNSISSDNYNNYNGYSIYIDSALNESVAVFDKVVVRKSFIYDSEEKVTYEGLMKLIKNKNLTPTKKYIITDFLDIRNITYSDETYLKSSGNTKLKNVYPIVVTAKSSTELLTEAYFLENSEWVIEYDPNYYYIAKYENGETAGTYKFAYSKGRILKMTDEFGNSANFDFKHATFTDGKYLFNTSNPRILELDKLIEINTDTTTLSNLNAEKSATNIYADATLDIGVNITVETNADNLTVAKFQRIKNTEIINNVIYLSEPTLVNSSVLPGTKEIVTNDYIIFDDCSTLHPVGNSIRSVQGKYKVLKQFDNNDIEGIVYTDSDEHQINSVFVNNKADIIYFKNENDIVSFDTNSSYINNTFGSVTNSEFRKGLVNNSFKDVENVIIDNTISGNIFKLNLLDLHILSSDMTDNIFEGLINTYNDSSYTIDGVLTNNVFKGDLECVTFDSTCIITDNEFADTIKYQSSIYTVFKGSISKCLFGEINGCIFDVNSLLYNDIFYNEDLYLYSNLTLVTIDKVIRNSLFKGDIINTHLYDDINRMTSEGTIGNSSSTSSFGEVDSSVFFADVLYITANGSNITNSTFNAEINNCLITGNINNCIFEGLSGGIEIVGPIDNVEVQVDMTPSTVSYVEDSDNAYITNSPFIISTQNVPKLSISGKKVCTIEAKSDNGSTINVFIIKSPIDDYTPAGAIIMFNGLASQIPEGWAICDGTKGTPDLRGRFIRATAEGESVGAKNNSDLVNNGNGTRLAYLDGSHVPKHTHNFKTYSGSYNIDTSNLTASYSGNVDLSNLSISLGDANTYHSNNSGTVIGKSAAEGTDMYEYTDTHSHTVNIGGTIGLPSITIGGSASILISITPEQDTESFPDKVNIEPLAYALIFIMKL